MRTTTNQEKTICLVPSTENESPLTPVASAPTSNDDVAIAAAGLALLSSSVIPTGDLAVHHRPAL
jgi:hypothetical protein